MFQINLNKNKISFIFGIIYLRVGRYTDQIWRQNNCFTS